MQVESSQLRLSPTQFPFPSKSGEDPGPLGSRPALSAAATASRLFQRTGPVLNRE
jgi:hypothetical protein